MTQNTKTERHHCQKRNRNGDGWAISQVATMHLRSYFSSFNSTSAALLTKSSEKAVCFANKLAEPNYPVVHKKNLHSGKPLVCFPQSSQQQRVSPVLDPVSPPHCEVSASRVVVGSLGDGMKCLGTKLLLYGLKRSAHFLCHTRWLQGKNRTKNVQYAKFSRCTIF